MWLLQSPGVSYATFGYDQFGRATSTKHAGNVDETTFAHDDIANTRTNISALGKAAVYTLGTYDNRLRIRDVDGPASTNCPASSKIVTRDTKGWVTQRTDEEGNVTK